MSDYIAFDSSPQVFKPAKSTAISLSSPDSKFDGTHHAFNRLQIAAVAMTSIIGLAALASVGTALFAMYLEGSILVYVCFAFPLIVAPWVVCQRSYIQWLPTFRDESNILRTSVNNLAIENSHLDSEISRLQRQINRLSMVEQRFEHLCRRERKDIDGMKVLIKEHAAIQHDIKMLQAADDIQELLSAILKADRDCDYILTEKELDEVMTRMRVVAGNSKFDEEAIRAAFKSSLTKKGASLIRIHSAMQEESAKMQEESAKMNEEVERLQFVVHTPVQTLQKIPRITETESVIDDFTGIDPIIATATCLPKVLSSGLIATRSQESYGTERQPINLVKSTDDEMIYGVDPTGNLLNHTDDTVLTNLLAQEEFDSVGVNKEAKHSIGYILQSFSGTIGAVGSNHLHLQQNDEL